MAQANVACQMYQHGSRKWASGKMSGDKGTSKERAHTARVSMRAGGRGLISRTVL